MRGTGRRRAGEDNIRLRQRIHTLGEDLAWYRLRLRDITARCRAATAQKEIAEGLLLQAEQLVQRQVAQLMERDTEIERLNRQLKADVVRTQPIPIVDPAVLAAA
ncbi:hypothetical protein ACIRU8_39045 [Streptomyces sp. NPDC101175]|uniref:hypothetical protein n=1 Tax=Streptomyces sp. NPDC101175 TaxID=3366123 RepID=UPI003832379C